MGIEWVAQWEGGSSFARKAMDPNFYDLLSRQFFHPFNSASFFSELNNLDNFR